MDLDIKVADYFIIGISNIPKTGTEVYFSRTDNSPLDFKSPLYLMIIEGTIEEEFLNVFFKGGENKRKWLNSKLKIAFVNHLPIALIIEGNICFLETYYVKSSRDDLKGYSNREYLKVNYGLELEDLKDLIREQLPKTKHLL